MAKILGRENNSKNSSNKNQSYNTRKANEYNKKVTKENNIGIIQLELEKLLKEKGYTDIWIRVRGETFSLDGVKYYPVDIFTKIYDLGKIEVNLLKPKISTKGKSKHKKYTPPKYR